MIESKWARISCMFPTRVVTPTAPAQTLLVVMIYIHNAKKIDLMTWMDDVEVRMRYLDAQMPARA